MAILPGIVPAETVRGRSAHSEKEIIRLLALSFLSSMHHYLWKVLLCRKMFRMWNCKPAIPLTNKGSTAQKKVIGRFWKQYWGSKAE